MPALAGATPVRVQAADALTGAPPVGVVLRVAAAAAVLMVVSICGLRSAGVEWFVVSSPSMGTAVPVGALVVDRPVQARALAVGDVITFDPPGATDAPHTHRIVAIGPRGLTTRGDANGAPDPWTVPAADVRGLTVAVLPGIGWLLRALPVLLIGGVITWVATLFARRADLRAAVTLIGVSCSVGAACLLLRPFVNAALLTGAVTQRGAVATVVATGMLPIRVTASGGEHIDLSSGQVGVLRTASALNRIDLVVGLHLAPPGWAAVIGLCALPLLVPVIAAVRGPR